MKGKQRDSILMYIKWMKSLIISGFSIAGKSFLVSKYDERGGEAMQIPLTPEVRTYATSVAQVGERMRLTGNRFGEAGSKEFASLEEIN